MKTILQDRFLFALSLQFVVVTLLIVLSLFHSGVTPAAHKGVLDLRGWNLAKDGIVKLNGEWEFYPNQLLKPQNFAEEGFEPSHFLDVPSVWNQAKTDRGEAMGAWGYATYRLTVKIDEADSPLAIRTTTIRFSDHIFVDGKLRSSLGKPDVSKETYKAENIPQLILIDSPGKQVEIVIQVANFDFNKGGLILPLYFGLSNDVLNGKLKSNTLEIAASTVFLLFGVFFLAMYSFYLRDRSFLIFGAYFIFFAIVTLLSGERIFFQLFPKVPFTNVWKIKDFFEYASVCLVFIFTWSMYKTWKYRKFVVVPAVLYGVFCLAISVLPLGVYIRAIDYVYPSIAVCYGLLIVVLLREYIQGNYGSYGKSGLQLYIVALLCLDLLFGDSYIFYFSQYGSRGLGSFAVFVFVLLITIMLMQRYFQTYTSLERLTIKLQASDQAKDEFLLRTSHELNTPLHGIINLSQAMLEETSAAKQHSDYKSKEKLEFIRNAAYRMSNMVNDIIDLSRMKDGRLDVKLTGVDLATCVSILFEVLAYLVKGKDIQLINKIDISARYVTADENRLMQVLYSIIDNSLKHTEWGSVTVSSRADGNNVTIVVEDTGAGIGLEHREILFRPYERGSNPYLEKSGLGLGLSVSQELVELMHGTLLLNESVDNQGACFEVTLPAFASEKVAEELEHIRGEVLPITVPGALASHVATADGVYTVLVVDDEVLQIELLINILAVEGYRVISARSAKEALLKIGHIVKPDIMLLDVLMSGGSGYEVSREVRKLYSPIDLPILFVTVRNTPADIEAGLAAGGNDFITKPFDTGEVRTRIRTLLAMKRLAKEAALNEMAFLQSQIKPHFLYNALGTIMSLCYTDGPRAGELLAVFSKYLRIIFHLDNTEETVSLRKEVELVQAYVEIEKARFGDRIQVMFDIDELLLGCQIMLLTIQPLVENAIRHGLAKKMGGGTVRLTIDRKEDVMRVMVEDDGVGMSVKQLRDIVALSKPDQGVGFANITRRMMHLTGSQPVVESTLDKGTKVTLWIPIIR